MDYHTIADAPEAYLRFLPIINILTFIGGVGWSVTYIAFTYLSLRHHTYGMPIVALCFNYSWELVFGWWYRPVGRLEQAIIIFWSILEAGLTYTTIKFALREWGHTRFMTQRNVALIMLLGVGFAAWFQIAIVAELGVDIGVMVGAAVAQEVLSVAQLAQLLERGSTRGTNWWVWIGRFWGTMAFAGNFLIRMLYWPEVHGWLDGQIMRWSVWLHLTCDLVYAVMYWRIRREEKRMGRDNALAWKTEGTKKRA